MNVATDRRAGDSKRDMTDSGQIVAALRDIAATKDLTPDELDDLLRDGITAGLILIYGPTV